MATANAAPRVRFAAETQRRQTSEPRVLSPPARRPVGGVALWVRAVRIRQWPKNLLVFSAPAAAGALGRPASLARTCVAVLAFCLLASGAYLFNDLRDAREDRRHPLKRHRPIASGAITPSRALAASAAAIAAGLALSAALGVASLGVALGYAALNFGYATWLRRVAIADIAAIAAAFVIRATAGGVATGVPISRWLFVVVSFAALFVAAGKRYGDLLDPAARRSRAVLAQYNADFLRMVIGVACAVALGAYCMWAFEGVRPGAGAWREATIVPFTIALLRYGLVVTDGRGGAPEEIVLGDRFMQVVVIVWALMFGLGL
ncbi:MAG: decaprenyl-phosphate phosphoribosyltransferase [Solirubrobacteraceae bacterium]